MEMSTGAPAPARSVVAQRRLSSLWSSSEEGWPDLDGQTQKSPHFRESSKPNFSASIVLHFYTKKFDQFTSKKIKNFWQPLLFPLLLTLKIELGWSGWSVPLQNE